MDCTVGVSSPAGFLLHGSLDDGAENDQVTQELYTTSPSHTSPALYRQDLTPTDTHANTHTSSISSSIEPTGVYQTQEYTVSLCYKIIVQVCIVTQVKPRQLMASASMSPSRDGHEFNAGKYACMWGLCQCTTFTQMHTQTHTLTTHILHINTHGCEYMLEL